MKLAVLSDVHGNVPALAAVLEDLEDWRADLVVVNGDLVSRGPYSLDCLRLVERHFPAARLHRGNHESYVLRCADTPADPASPTHDIDRFARWAALQLGAAVEEIRDWNDHLDLTGLDQGASVHITHGSRLGDRDGLSVRVPDEELPEKLGDPRDLFIGSHTHKPMLRSFNGSLVVNTGSVGQPMDGDPRAAYGRFTLQGGRWQAEIRRLAYDKARAEQDFIDSGFLEEAGPIPALIYLELQESRAHLGPWRRQYLAAIQAGEIGVVESIARYRAAL
jgi:predicted phosphodiesterase